MRQAENVTRDLAGWVVGMRLADIPPNVQREGVRTFFNWIGCAVGGARHPTVERALAAATPFSGPPSATVIGRGERLDALHAALLNGISSHVLDFDDTHLKTIIHPAAPVASAILAVAELRPVSGAALLEALVAGVEVACRIGNAVYPDHYDRGWHITGTAGVFGAAAAVGKLIGLDAQKLVWALGLAATQSSGLREMFGTMTKSFHPGRAAQNGAFAAFLAEAGFDSSERALEAPRGFAGVLSTKQDYSEIVSDLGTRWEAGLNTYKPFACGIVIHPTIDGCIALGEKLGQSVSEIVSVKLKTHPLVLELTGKTEPRTGLEGKFSVYHAAAAALLRGDGSPGVFTDEAVNDPALVALRRKIRAEADPGCREDEVRILIALADGQRIESHVEHAIGSIDRPLTDRQLEAKFFGQAAPVIGDETARRLMELAWALPHLADAGEAARRSVPQSTSRAVAR